MRIRVRQGEEPEDKIKDATFHLSSHVEEVTFFPQQFTLFGRAGRHGVFFQDGRQFHARRGMQGVIIHFIAPELKKREIIIAKRHKQRQV